jgi:hypothetical protein
MSNEIELAERLTRIEEGQKHLEEKLDLHHKNLELQLSPILELREDVKQHDRDISWWKGVNAMIVFIGTLLAAFFGKIHWLHS